ncbi:MAG: RIP metalloprotease RseP [Leadbetterella sp.]
MDVLIKIAQFLLALTLLVGLHEFGHFFFARLFKIRVSKFYIFFDFLFPMDKVMNFALWKKKIGDTEYGLGWFPLGGYVSIDGMVDETKDASSLSEVPQPWEFRAKPAWQRILVMLGGIIVNVIIGIIIFIGIKYTYGEEYLSKEELNKKGIYAYPLAQEVGLKTGDKIIKVKGQDFVSYNDINRSLIEQDVSFEVLRGTETLVINIPNDLINKIAEKNSFIGSMFEFEVASTQAGLGAAKADIQKGDKITQVNGVPTPYFHVFTDELSKYKNKEINLTVDRKGKLLTKKTKVNEEGKIGVQTKDLTKTTTLHFEFLESIKEGTKEALAIIPLQIKQFAKIFSGDVKAKNSVGGLISMTNMFPGYWDWSVFWKLTGMISMALAFMNALPIPALDGGHVIMLLYEMISRRKPSEKFLERTQQVGTVLLLSLMAFAMFNDVRRWFEGLL